MRRYSAGAVKHCFWFAEFRKAVTFLENGLTWEEIRTRSEQENIFGSSTPRRAAEMLQVVSARIRSLDQSFRPVFLHGDIATQKTIALIAAMTWDRLFFDLVYEVIRDKLMIGSDELTDSDVRTFFRIVQQRDSTAAKWTDQTCTKLAGSYKTMLYESGVTNKARTRRKIYRPVLNKELEQWLKTHELSVMIRALTGEG